MLDLRNSLFARKPFAQLERDVQVQSLRRTLGPVSLATLGIGATIGAGIFVLTGHAAANFAGPAIVLSFVLAGLACAFTAMCYAELAAAIPAAGSAYSYAYATLGELPAWIMGWLMVLEYGIAVSLVSVGFSGYVVSLLHDAGLHVPAALATPLIRPVDAQGGVRLAIGDGVNLVAACGVLLSTALLLRGVSLSAKVNAAIVILKVGVLTAFVAVGYWWTQPANWTPFVPPNEGGFTYGWEGVFRAASMAFYAYVGFETVSTAAAEARDPQRDLPRGIIAALIACTALYIAVAAVLTGIIPFRQLGVPDPIALAVNEIGLPGFGALIKIGAVVGLCSVMLAVLYGQTRIFYAIAHDGLLPPVFARVHPQLRVPLSGTLIVGAVIAAIAALLPITLLVDLISLGVSVAFAVVCFSVIWLRSVAPQIPRPFRVPLGGIRIGGIWVGIVPALGILFCLLMILPLAADIIGAARAGNALPAALLSGYLAVGLLIYVAYGWRRSKLRAAALGKHS